MSGLNTLLQTLIGTRLPTVMGPSFAYLLPVLSIINDFADEDFPSEHQVYVKMYQAWYIYISMYQTWYIHVSPWYMYQRMIHVSMYQAWYLYKYIRLWYKYQCIRPDAWYDIRIISDTSLYTFMYVAHYMLQDIYKIHNGMHVCHTYVQVCILIHVGWIPNFLFEST